MVKLNSFERILQHVVSQGDSTWDYVVPELPTDSQTDDAQLVRSVAFVSTAKGQGVRLRLVSVPSNRITKAEPLHLFLLLSFENFRLRLNTRTEDGVVQFAPARDSAGYIARLLKTGISINGTRYHFFGHSNSQLKSRSCFMFAASKDAIKEKVDALGDFSKMQTVGKKAKRLGLLFSSADVAIELPPDRCQDIDDVSKGDYTFTDGCGLISSQMAAQIVQRRKIAYRNKRYLPSVFQIRYRGYKGVLTVDPTLKGQKQVLFRQSMKKLKDVQDFGLSIVDCSKPYAFGHLNDEVVVLLHALGITTDALLRKQKDFLQFLADARNGVTRAAFQFLSYQNEMELAEKLLMTGFDAVRAKLRKLVDSEHSKMLNKRDEQRCRIMMPQSRLLFGVCDPSGRENGKSKLAPGTCFVRVTLDGNGEARTIVNTEVLVTRNPCLHPGDLQKFKAVDVPEFSHLVDCIVFPTRGDRPSADLMSGGDLDGDKFFVTWDPDIVPRTIAQAAEYPGIKERIHFGKITDDDRADFFANYNNMSLGRVKNLYLKWARLKGSMSPECQQLNRLFSQCVDGNRIKVPPGLEDPPEPAADADPFVLDVLHAAACETIVSVKRDIPQEDWSIDVLGFVAHRECIAMSEFELIQLVLQKCEQTGQQFHDYLDLFNYTALNDNQRAWLLSRTSAAKETRSLVLNGMLQSELVLPAELRKFALDDHRLHWKPVFMSNNDRMAQFLPCAAQAMQTFHKKLIVFQADERLTLMVYIPQKVEKAAEVQVDASVRVFALPRSSGSDSGVYRVMPTARNYRLFADDNVFQLYKSKRADTWVYLTRGEMNTTAFKAADNTTDKRRKKQQTLYDGTNFDCRASVALNKIGTQVSKHIGRMNRAGIMAAEIYVISNRDVESMRYLDQWLDYIDTNECLPLFENVERDYRVSTLEDFDKTQYSATIVKVVWGKNLEALRDVKATDEIREVLTLLRDSSQKIQLQAVYVSLTNADYLQSCHLDPAGLIDILFKFLPESAFLTQTLLESELWDSWSHILDDTTNPIFQDLLKELVLSYHSLPSFIKEPFRTILGKLNHLQLRQLAELLELIALCISEPEFAVDLLMECIEPETSRLLTGRLNEVSQPVSQLMGIALDHIDEAHGNRKYAEQALLLQHDGFIEQYVKVKATLRIDSPQSTLKTGDHIRFVAAQPPENAPYQHTFVMDATVINAVPGAVTFRCLHQPPSYLADCAWKYRNCGSFITSKVMIDAVSDFYTEKESCCGLYSKLAGLSQTSDTARDEETVHVDEEQQLNASQNEALRASMQHDLTFLWGPPGTGKTQTIVVILQYLLRAFPKSRVLVTAPTHNAVDNILQRYLAKGGAEALTNKPLRVATSLGKVAPALREYTCDAFVGKDLSESSYGRRKAQQRVKDSRLIFTTCIGAGLGLLRSEEFDIVLVDEASQQTEPETLVPLTKGCKRAILVGDHVQLRATIQKHAQLTGLDISLFERHYTSVDASGIAKVMLDTQYRMHPDICDFSSSEFYQGLLQSAPAMQAITLPVSNFPWPENGSRKVFVQCNSPEDLGKQSKANQGQAELCQKVCKLLASNSETSTATQTSSAPASEVAVLTPYTRQREFLENTLPSTLLVSSIDGFQGREADIIVFVTVRCNVHHDIGFLKDLRRLNVAMTRAKAGVIVIGDRKTLTGSLEDDGDEESRAVWRRLLQQRVEVEIRTDA